MAATGDSTGSIILSGTDYDLPDDLGPGLKKYTDFREMAHGATSMLQSCWDTVIGRTVAVKSLLPDYKNDRRENRRLLREARVTAQLQHPNTVPVYEIGRDPDAGLYFTMKRVSGENFFEVLKRIARQDEATIEAFPLWRRVEIAIDACQALSYAHARGVIHRDMKPENIWVGNFGEVVLLDWGVAKVWGHPDDPDTKPTSADEHREADSHQGLTQAGQRPGTPLYMAPEQIDGRHVDERSDIFSTGVVLYELLTVSEPFRGRTIDETFNNIRNFDPDPPSKRSPDREIPPQMDSVVMRALAKHPSYRFQSMRDMIRATRDAMPTASDKAPAG